VEQDVSEQDRSYVTQLSQQQVLDFIQKNESDFGKRASRYSVSSNTDKQGHLVRSFSSKQLKLEGEGFDSSADGIGFACKKGLKPEAPNQDSFLILRVDDAYALYGVFDGHGRKGHDVSNFVKDNLPKVLFSQEQFLEDPGTALLKTFEKTQYLLGKATAMKTIDATRSGSTVSVVLHDFQKGTLHIAHVGDSRIVLGKQVNEGGNKAWQAVDLTIDHKPDLPEERARIEKAGGVVLFDGGWNYRVFAKGKTDSRGKRYPGLNMSRAMGDLNGFNDAGISAVPDVTSQVVKSATPDSEKKNGNGENSADADDRISIQSSTASVSQHSVDPDVDKFILICSDGVWEFITSERAVQEIANYPPEAASQGAERLAQLAWDNWIRQMDGQVVDDITAVVVHFK
jgi:serine/threonine protein phosphatase PrpC